jgi:cell wall-associated NlpC family hydrolase
VTPALTALGPTPGAIPPAGPPATVPGGFRDALTSALDATAPAPAPGGGTAPAPAAVPLARMLAVLGAASGAATAPTWPSATSAAVAAGAAVPPSPVDGGSPAAGGAIVAAAERYLGIPYRWGGSDPATGLDCSGLVQLALRDLGVKVPRTSVEQSRVGQPVGSLAEARPGDLLFWASSRPGQANHIGIYVGDGKMLHAPYTGEVVKVAPVRTAPPTTIRRVTG